MRALVVYESMYGNTHQIAEAVGAGLRTAFDVSVIPVAQATPAVLADAGLVVVGGPTHMHGMSQAASRKTAAETAEKPDSPLRLDADAPGPGLREWFGSLGRYPVKAAAFDTRVHGPAALTGQASKEVAKLLRAHGFDVAARPESFLVTKQNHLEPQEAARAREWGAKLAASVAPSLAGDAGGGTLRILDPAECLDLLEPGGVGRVGFAAVDGIMMLPVNFAVAGNTIVFRTAPDTLLAVYANGQVSFEADYADQARREGWSVLVHGHAHKVADEREIRRLEAGTTLTPWAGGARDVFVRIAPVSISGRRVRPGEPDHRVLT